MRFSFDREKIASDMRAAAAVTYAEAIAAAATAEERQFLEAQQAMLEANIIQVTTFAEVRGAGMKLSDAVRLMAAHCSSILSTCLAQVPDEGRSAVRALFLAQLCAGAENPCHETSIEARGTPGGRA